MTQTYLTNQEKIQIIEQLADEYGCDGMDSLREAYSGRGMFGRKCYGVVTDQSEKLIESAAEMGLTGVNTDSMGLDVIVYWPQVNGVAA